MKYFLIIVAALSSISSLAARHKIFKRYAAIIKRADSVLVFTIEANLVEEKAQDSTRKYIADYPVANKIALSKDSMSSLKKAVLQKENYLIDIQKRCPFEGEFAVLFTKGKKTVTLIISRHSCSKIVVYLPGAVSVTPYDLTDTNSIEKVLPKAEVERL